MDLQTVKVLSENTNSKVTLAVDTVSGQLYTVKDLELDSPIGSTVNIDLIEKLNHVQIQKLVNYKISGNSLQLTYKYIEGVPMGKHVDLFGHADERTVVRWLRQLSQILDYLHTSFDTPIIHRDIKPDNLIIDKTGNIHLIDFGIARLYNNNNLKDTVRLGSIGFAPPEQYGSGQTDERSDIYGLGVSMFFALTGKSLNEPPYQVIPPSIMRNSVSKKLSNIIVKCSQFNPEFRYFSAAELLRDILKLEQRAEKSYIKIVQAFAGFVLGVGLALCVVFLTGSTPTQRVSSEVSIGAPYAEELQKAVEASPAHTPVANEKETAAELDAKAIDPDTVISFSDPELESLLRIKLDKQEGTNVTAEEMAAITSLEIMGDHLVNTDEDWRNYWDELGSIQTLADLKYCTSLNYLCIGGQLIQNLEGITELTSLQILYLPQNQINDITGIGNLSDLRDLMLPENPIMDLSALEGLPRLQYINLDRLDFPVENIDFVSSMPYLEGVFIDGSSITTLEPLRGLYQFSAIAFGDSKVEDFSPISNNPRLTWLRLGSDKHVDFEGLDNLPNLTTLELTNGSLKEVSVLLRFPTLHHVDLANNSIEDFSGIENLKKLEYLNVTGNPDAGSEILKVLSLEIEVVGIE